LPSIEQPEKAVTVIIPANTAANFLLNFKLYSFQFMLFYKHFVLKESLLLQTVLLLPIFCLFYYYNSHRFKSQEISGLKAF